MTETWKRVTLLLILASIGHAPTLAALALIKAGYAKELLDQAVINASGFAQVAASFAFSMLGFMAAVMALFSVLGQSRSFRKYRKNGHLFVLLCGIAIALIELVLAFVSSMQAFFRKPTIEMMSCISLTLIAALGMVVVCCIPIVALQIRASLEKA